MTSPAARLPPAVVAQIVDYAAWPHTLTRRKEICHYSLVHPSWTGPAQALLWEHVYLWEPDRIGRTIVSPAIRKHPTDKLTLAGGRGKRKIEADLAARVMAAIGPIKHLDLQTINDLTPNSFFGAPLLGSALTSLEVNMAIKDIPKGTTLIAPPSRIPLRKVTLGAQSIAVAFLEPLFAAATATLQTLSITLNPRSTPNLIRACPTILPDLTELNVQALRNDITHVERAFFPLLAACANLRSLGWEWNDFFQLQGAVNHLPDQGARLERLGIGLYGPAPVVTRVRDFLNRPGYTGLRELRVVGGGEADKAEVRRVCVERRVLLN